MAQTTPTQNIDTQITNYVSGLSAKNKNTVLNIVKSIADAESKEEFEKKWAKGGLTPEQLRQDLLLHVRSLEWKK